MRAVETPDQDDLYTIGTKAIISKMTRPRDGMVELMVQGVERVVLLKIEQTTPVSARRACALARAGRSRGGG